MKKSRIFREPHVYLSRGSHMLKYVAIFFAKKRELRKKMRKVWCWNPAALAIKTAYMDP